MSSIIIGSITINLILDFAIFILFIIAVITVGLLKSGGKGKHTNSEDYFLAGRGLSWWIIGVSLISANISTEQFVGMSGSASGPTGMAIASYEWMAAIALVFIGWFFLPKFLKSGIYTIPQFLEYRYDAASRTLMSLLMVVVLVCVNTTAVIYSGAIVVETVLKNAQDIPFGISMEVACWSMGTIAAIYVCAGGLKAAAWADLIQGTALILGGMVIAYFTYCAFSSTPVAEIATTSTFSPETLAALSDESTLKKFFTLNSDKLTMFRPASDPVVPWTALIIGLWIPNFYYWGLNQYIIQRTLGAKSLSEGQKGIMFAAGLKLIIPFIIVIPGIMAFNLYSGEQRASAQNDRAIITSNAKNYATIYFDALERAGKPVVAAEMIDVFSYSLMDGGAKTCILSEATINDLYKKHQEDKTNGNLARLSFNYDKGWAANNPDLLPLVDAWNSRIDGEINPNYAKTLYGYKYDSAFGLLVSKVIPAEFGLRGFIFAAMFGAVVSSLAAMLNAASTIFTIDLYKKFLAPKASDRNQVMVGRIAVLVFAAIACIIAPKLADPNLGTIFDYIQEFQGYLSPGILAVFLFGMFSKRAPRFAGVLGILTSPVVYGILYFFFNNIAFLNRMAITFGMSLLVMLILTFIKPLKRDIVMPVNENMDISSSLGARVAGICVLIFAVVLYITFSGLWF